MFYVEYGRATALEIPALVWTNAFTGVYHFGDGVTLAVDDSTGANPGTNNGATAAPGMIGGAAAFSGGPNVAASTVGLDLSAGALTTATFWVDYTGAFGKGPIAFVDGANAYDLWFEADGCRLGRQPHLPDHRRDRRGAPRERRALAGVDRDGIREPTRPGVLRGRRPGRAGA